MSGTDFQYTCLSDQRLAVHALSPTPVWLWSADATRVLWTNPIAATIFDAASSGALAAIRFEPQHTAAAQVARLAGTLPQGGAARLERLRGFGAGYGGTLICLCSRIVLSDNSPAVLVVSTERANKGLALPDRVHRLLADLDRPAAVFTADGELIEAVPAVHERFGDKRDLVALGAEQIAREASANGRADGNIAAWPATVLRLGAGATVTLLVAFAAPEKAASTNSPAAVAAPIAPSSAALEAHDFGRELEAPMAPVSTPTRAARNGDAARDIHEGQPIFDRLPVGILVYRLNTLIYANRAFLDWTGYPSLEALSEAGGLDSLFIDTKSEPPASEPRNEARRSPSPPSMASRSRWKAACSARPGTTRTRWC
jgi:PAS domain